MPNIRIKDIPTTASATSSTDFIAIDGATNGTRKLSADSPVFSGNVTVNGGTVGTAASTNLTLAGGSSGASLVLGQGATKPVTITTGTGHFVVSGGNLGLGTTSPTGYAARVVHINDTSGSTSAGIKLTNNTTGTTNDDGLDITVSGNTALVIQRENAPLDIYTNATFAARYAASGNLLIGGTTDITGSGGLKVFGTTASTSTTTGALQVAGGVGVAGALFAGGASRIPRIGLGADPDADYKLYSFVSGGTNNPILLARTGLDAPIAFDLVHTTRILNFVDRQFPSTRFSFDFTNGNFVATGSLTTSAPTGGAGAWELGVANTVTPTAPNRTITIEIDGTVYYLAAKTTND